ncbi:hypothetical protein ACTXT7_007075 [Hymenolepis weldensis]
MDSRNTPIFVSMEHPKLEIVPLLLFENKNTCMDLKVKILLGDVRVGGFVNRARARQNLIAVLCPRGPLRMLVEMAQERNRPLFPAIIYSTAATYISNTVHLSSTTTTSNTNEEGIPLKTADERAEAQTLVNANERLLSSLRRRHPESTSMAPARNSGDEPRNHVHPNGAMNRFLSHVYDMSRIKGNQSHLPVDSSNIHQEWQNPTPPLTTGASERLSHEMTTTEEQPEVPNEWLRDLQEDVIEREERGVKLGLGDFVFYSVLIGRASLDGDILTAMSCYVAILVGMCLTIVALAVARRALPALPISIICGIIFYFSTAAVITPFIHALSEKRLFF